jgi:hypothetical protein
MKEIKEYYRQTKSVSWLLTKEGTIWVSTIDDYIQPESVQLITTCLGINLSLIDDENLFELIPTKQI